MEGKRGRPSKKDIKAMEKSIRWSLDPETTRSIVAIVLIIVGFILLLSVFGGAGAFGGFLVRVLRMVVGYLVFLVPLVLIAFGIGLFFPQRFVLRAPTILGTVVLIITLAAILHLFILPESSFKVAEEGGGGGFIGFLIAYIFLYIFNFWASLIILIGILIIATLIAFNVSLKTVGDKFKDFAYYLGFGEGSEEMRINNPGEQKRRWFSFGRKPKEEKPVHETSELVASGPEAWQPPPLDLLESKETQPSAGDIRKRAEIIRRTLENFGIEVKMGEVNVGPTVTQYTLKPETGVKLNQIVARQNDLSLALAAHPIRTEAPIPGKDAVGIEVPNTSPAIVRARPILESKEFENLKSPLKLAIGKDVSGEPVVTDLAKMPHLLIAGSTGSGKSVCINSIITALLYDNSPSKLRMILVDPKRVEFTQYNGVPHLLTPVITRHEQTISALRWSVKEMDDRFNLFQQAGKRDITSFNSGKSSKEKMPYIIIIIDELADLMAVAARDVEASIVRLAQLARATGIHLVVATQRPSVDVITGLIKANITCRIAFAVASNVDSRTILDMSGAERLLGNGDMLFLHFSAPKPKRVQGVFLSDQEIHRVTGWLKKHGAAHYQEDILTYEPEKGMTFGAGESFDDEKFDEAVEIVLNSKRASASLLQRHLRIGYARAARLLDMLEEQGLVGPSDGTNRSREILIDRETYARVKAAEEESKNDKDKPQPPSGIPGPPPPPSTDSGQPRDFERNIDMGEIDN